MKHCLSLTCFGALLLAGAGFAHDTAGIGVAVGKQGDTIVVAAVLSNTPAASSHTFKINDRIIAVGQGDAEPVSTTGMNIVQVVQMIRGAKGTVVRLTMIPAGGDGSQARVVSFVRGELKALSDWGDGELLEKGTQAPEVQLLRLPDNDIEKLADYRGKIVVLEFWATWCAPCQDAMRNLQTLASNHPEWKGKLELIAVNIDEKRDLALRRLKERNWNQTHNVWAAMDVVRSFHVGALPTPYVLDAQGKIVAAGELDLSTVLGRLLH
ncbi:MAG: TlpA family protein disulfide reductase [Limisphaerales bacterium]